MNIEIRKVQGTDLLAIKDTLNSIDLFPGEMLDEMIANYLENPESEDLWFTAIRDELPIAVGFCAPEQLTEGTFNLYAIGVHKDLQGKGIGGQMMDYLERELSRTGQRILIVETSGTADFHLTRKFYEDLGYTKEAVIRDFWKQGDDKVIYWKKLQV